MRPARLLFIISAILALALPAAANKPRGPSGSIGGKELTFIFMRDADTTTMSGSLTDLERVRKVLKNKERVLWFRMPDGKEFLVRDAATLDRFEAAWKAAEVLALKQGEIGGKQGLIGMRQGAVGTKQGALGARQGVLATKQARLEEQADEADTASERDAFEKKRRVLEAEMRELEKKMRVLEAEMRELEKPMRVLEREMNVVQKQHEAASDRAHADSEALIARAITSGVAKPF